MRVNIRKIREAVEIGRISMQRHHVPGAAAAFIVNGKTTETITLGLADPEREIPITDNTHFEAASLTKPVFAMTVQNLVAEGKLELDRPLYEYVPDAIPTEDPRGKKITAIHVLSHGTGLPNWGEAPLPLIFTPGEEFGYSGKGYTYLQTVVERLTGRRIDDLMQTEIFNPLGMEDAAMIWTGPLNRTLARTVDEKGNIEPKRQRCQRTVALEPNSAFSLCVTIKDYPLFVEAIMQDKAYLQMVTSYRNTADHGVEWGLGWGLYQDLIWHWGDNGGFKSFVCFDPQTKDGIVIHTNGANGLEVCYDMISAACEYDLSDIRKMVAHAEE